MRMCLIVLLSFFSCMGMDFITQTHVESVFSQNKRNILYQDERDKLLCVYKCLYPDELYSRYSLKERNEMVQTITSDLEKKVVDLKKELTAQLQMEGAGLASTAANGIALYYSDHIMTLAGFLGSLMWSAIYLEDTILETRVSLRFNSRFLRKFKNLELLKKMDIVISNNYQERNRVL